MNIYLNCKSMNCSSELKGPESLKLNDASVISGSRLEPEFLCENLCSYMYPIECISPLLLTLVSACSPSYRPAQRAVLGRPAFLHTVCICPFSSFFANALSLPPPVLSCRSACSSQRPNGNRQTEQHDSDNITTLTEHFCQRSGRL